MDHSHKCRYKDTDKLQYALMEIVEGKLRLIAANEIGLFDKYLEFSRNDDKEVVLDLEQAEEEPFQIVYGGMLLNDKVDFEQALSIAEKLAGYAIFDLEEDKVNVSAYEDIAFYPEDSVTDNYIPFAALMQTVHRLQNMTYSISMFPSMGDYSVWEAMVNRPFILACRESAIIDGISKDNWKKFIDKEKMLDSYKVADLVTD